MSNLGVRSLQILGASGGQKGSQERYPIYGQAPAVTYLGQERNGKAKRFLFLRCICLSKSHYGK